MYLIVGLLLSLAIGLSLGLLGGGGSIITVPVLVYVLGVEVHQAIAMSLAVVGATSLVAVGLHARRGTVQYKTGVIMSTAGMLGAYYGSRLTYLFAPATLLLALAGVMLSIAILMLTRKERPTVQASGQQRHAVKMVLAGLSVGGLTGLLGVGGGFLVVPALTLCAGLPMHAAIGTSLLVITINCAAGLLGHLHYGGFDLHLALLVTVLAVIGTLLGVAVAHRTSPARLRQGFAMLIMAVAMFLVAKNYTALL
jgi:uncharacterized membrane protein YfcA